MTSITQDFVFTFCSNFGTSLHCFGDIAANLQLHLCVMLAEASHGLFKNCYTMICMHAVITGMAWLGISVCGLKEIARIWPFLSLFGLRLTLNYVAFGMQPLNLVGICDLAMWLANELSLQQAMWASCLRAKKILFWYNFLIYVSLTLLLDISYRLCLNVTSVTDEQLSSCRIILRSLRS